MIKVNCNVPLGSGLNPYQPLRHHILDVLGGLISGAFGLAGQAAQASYTKEQQKLQSKLNKEEMATSQGMQNAQQDWLMNTQYGKMVSGMKNAGLNPATANGTTPVTPSAGHGSSGGVGPSGPPTSSLGADIMQGVSAGAGVQNTMADTKLKEAQAKNLDADTSWKNFMNTPEYRKATLEGIQNSALKDWWNAKNQEKGIELTDQEIVYKAQLTKNLGRQYDLTGAQINQLNAVAAESYARILEIKQNMKESEFRILYHRAAANAQNAAAENYRESARDTRETRGYRIDVLKSTSSELNSRSGLNDANQMLTNEKRHTETKNQKLIEIETVLKDYQRQCNEIYTPTERGGIQFAKDVLGLMNPFQGIIAINSGN